MAAEGKSKVDQYGERGDRVVVWDLGVMNCRTGSESESTRPLSDYVERRFDRILSVLYGIAVGFCRVIARSWKTVLPTRISGGHSAQVAELMFDCGVR